MSPSSHPAPDAASAIAQAIGAILYAMLDALFGDISGLSPRHPVRRMHARTRTHIDRYVAALTAALRSPAEETSADAPVANATPTPAGTPLARPALGDRDHAVFPPFPRSAPRATPPPRREKPVWHPAHSRAYIVTISK